MYDGSEKLKMIGNDCLLIEKNCDVLLNELLKTDETWDSPNADKLKKCLQVYRNFADLAQ